MLEPVTSIGLVASSLKIVDLSVKIDESLEMMGLLEADVDALLGKDTGPESLKFKAKVKFVWNEKLMKKHLEMINYLASALHLLDATKLRIYVWSTIVCRLLTNPWVCP